MQEAARGRNTKDMSQLPEEYNGWTDGGDNTETCSSLYQTVETMTVQKGG